ncbi:hypothetical protein FPOA_00127 [Fusarium poae]|uniref:Uncharacterized protein n=1 Tax=Fusarium poae TaxID=36050 RepID=A0A1B8B0H6_FUSPO|nr:hypothetical protein FPOA_00127 [Fusarium poae]
MNSEDGSSASVPINFDDSDAAWLLETLSPSISIDNMNDLGDDSSSTMLPPSISIDNMNDLEQDGSSASVPIIINDSGDDSSSATPPPSISIDNDYSLKQFPTSVPAEIAPSSLQIYRRQFSRQLKWLRETSPRGELSSVITNSNGLPTATTIFYQVPIYFIPVGATIEDLHCLFMKANVQRWLQQASADTKVFVARMGNIADELKARPLTTHVG